MPTRPTEVLSAITAALSLLLLALFVVSARSSESIDRLRCYCLCVIVGIALNAFICGALSGPKGRYEMRVIWVLPLIAGAIVSTGSANWRRRSVTSPEVLPEVA